MIERKNDDGQLEFVREDGLTIFAPSENDEAGIRAFAESDTFKEFTLDGDNTPEVQAEARAFRFYLYQGEPVKKKATRKRKPKEAKA